MSSCGLIKDVYAKVHKKDPNKLNLQQQLRKCYRGDARSTGVTEPFPTFEPNLTHSLWTHKLLIIFMYKNITLTLIFVS